MTKPLWSRVLDTELPTSTKMVLLSLVNHSDRQHQCWPSVALMAKETGLSVRSVRYHMRLLERLEVVVRQKRESRRGPDSSNLYTLATERIICSLGLQQLQGEGAPVAPLLKSPNEDTQMNTPSEYFVLTAEDEMRHQIDEGPDQVNLFAQTPEPPAKKKAAPAKPVEEWNFSDLAKDFGFQAERYFPTRANRVNVAGLAGGLKHHAENTGADVHLQLALIDAFFDDMNRGRIGPDAPLWKQFLARLDELTKRAEYIKTQTRELRQGRSKHEPKPVYATDEERIAAYRELHGETNIIWED